MKVFEWDDLRVFLAVLRGRSVRAASKLMGVSHSTVSRRLQAMESQLGIKLFIRHPEGFVLTETGEAMVERAERVESEILSMEREVFGRDASLSLYPEIEIEIDATFEIANLSRRNADIAIRFQAQPDKHLIGHRLPDFASAIYATPDYISAHTFTGPEPTGRWVGWGLKEVLTHWNRDSAYINCKIQHVILDPFTHLQAVKAGMGFSNLLCLIGDNELGLARLPGDNPQRTMPTWVLTHPDLVSTERVRVCVRFLVDAIYKHEAELSGKVS